MDAKTRMTRARTRLLLDQPWFGSLAMRLRIEPLESIPTCATDGTTLFYNSEFVVSLPDAQLVFVMAHEVLHCALCHMYRRGSRDMERWNRAADYAINLDLKAAGFQLTPDCLIDAKYAGLSSEVIYAQLQSNPNDQAGKQPLSTGSVMDATKAGQPAPGQPGDKPGDAPAAGMTEEDWKIAAEQATAISKAAGLTPADAARSAKAARQVPEDWRAILREFIEHQVPNDYSWASPNRRLIAEGLYLPGITKENMGPIGVCVDTSGSISPEVLSAFAQELTEIVLEARPEKVHVVYCDARVKGTQDFTPDDFEVNLDAKGGGGTAFSPALDYFTEAEEQPVAVLYFTDLENGGEKVTEPAFPVLWVTGKNVTKSAPFGQVVRIDANV